MPFSLTNSPGTFERLIPLVLKGLEFKICLSYLDDIILFAETFQEYLQWLETVFERFVSAGLKLKPIGHIVIDRV